MRCSARALSATAFILLAFFVPACGSSSSNTTDAGPSAGADSPALIACRSVRSAYLEFRRRCGAPEFPQDDTSTAQRDGACADSLSARGAGPKTAALDSCVAALADAKCTEGLPSACRLAGTLEDGTPCLSGLQCASSHCAFDENAACGKCAPVLATGALCEESIMAFGGGCDSDGLCVPDRNPEAVDFPVAARCIPPSADEAQPCKGALCAPGLACQLMSSDPASNICARPLAVGEACSQASAPCAQGTACIKGKCTAKSGEGEPCFPLEYPPLVVSTSTCGDGLACANTCKPITMVRAGDTCNVDTLQCVHGFCLFGGGSTGTCTAYIPVGSPCDTANIASRCEGLAACIGGVCKLRDASACK